MRITTTTLILGTLFTSLSIMQACGDSGGSNEFADGSTGTTASGGSNSGGGNSGGSASGGTASGGTASGGGNTGGNANSTATGGATGTGGGTTGTGGGTSGTGGGMGTGGGAGDGPIGPVCGSFGDSCNDPGDCCSEICEASSNTCGRNVIACLDNGSDCSVNTDCCSFNCDGGSCSASACVDDGEACTNKGPACCSGTCADGTCADINGYASCKSSGNSCEDNGDCCSGLCEGGHCSQKVSYCVQLNDICTSNPDCCSGSCVKGDGAEFGYCGTLEVGPERCKDGQAGMICGNDCAQCCSRACGPGPAGVFICQPPSGCRPAGELCVRDTDCCGGDADSGLPGAGETDAFCERVSPDDVFGRCKSSRCTPQGDVCQLNGGLCSESSQLPSNCCPTNANPSNPNWQKGACEYDPLGIPRCNGFADDYCVPEGGSCSQQGDCCDERPCVPDPDDNNRLKCGTKECNEDGDTCTTNADCCIGNICYIAAGEIHGSCSPPDTTTGGTGGTGGSPGTGGTTSTGGTGGTTSTGGAGGTTGSGGTGNTPCSAYSQTCSQTSDCCDASLGVECLTGRCLIQN